MFGKKKNDKDKGATPEKGKKPGKADKAGEKAEPKSPRGGADEGSAADGAASSNTVAEEVMFFSLGETRLGLTHRKLLNDTVFYDLELFLGGAHKKNPPTRAHRAVLQVRCPALLVEGKFIGKIDRKKDRWAAALSETALPTLTPVVLAQLMVYLYSGTMEVPRFSLPTLLDMCAVAAALGLEEVVWLCEHKVREVLNVESVHSILKGAEDRGLAGVKNFSLEYAFAHWNDFIGNTEGAKILGLELFQDVSAKNAKGEKITYPEGPQPPNTIVADYHRLYKEMPMADLQLEVHSEKLNCHRAILAMYSDGLANRFRAVLKAVGQVQVIRLIDEADGVLQSPSAVDSFLKFVYFGETKMDPIDACEMIHKVNSVFKLNTFQLMCEHTIVNNINVKSVVPILGVTYIKGFDQKPHIQVLRKQALQFIIANFGATDLSALAHMPPDIRLDLLNTLQKAFQEGKLGRPLEGSTTQLLQPPQAAAAALPAPPHQQPQQPDSGRKALADSAEVAVAVDEEEDS